MMMPIFTTPRKGVRNGGPFKCSDGPAPCFSYVHSPEVAFLLSDSFPCPAGCPRAANMSELPRCGFESVALTLNLGSSEKFQDTMRRFITCAVLLRHFWQHDVCTVNLCEEHGQGVPGEEWWLGGR